MQTDLELLEMSALAARCDFYSFGSEFDATIWNPLESDDQAFRLALHLQISFWVDDYHACCSWASNSVTPFDGMDQLAEEIVNGCVREASRRAIVRAAAEIYKASLRK